MDETYRGEQNVNIPEETNYPCHPPGDQPQPDPVQQSRHEEEQVQRVLVTKIIEEGRQPGQCKAFAVDVQPKKVTGEHDSRFVNSCSTGPLRAQFFGSEIAPLWRIKLVPENQPNGHERGVPGNNNISLKHEIRGNQCNAHYNVFLVLSSD